MKETLTVFVICATGFFIGMGWAGPTARSEKLQPDKIGGPGADQVQRQVRTIVDVRAKEAAATRVSMRLDYLSEVPDVAWYVVQGNDVYLGCHGRSESTETIVREAAIHASQAYPSDFRVWAVPADEIARVGQTSMPFFCRATGSDGAVVNFSQQ